MPGELARLIKDVKETLARMEGRMLTVEMFGIHQQAFDRRFSTIERDQTNWEAESRSAHATLDGRIEAVKTSATDRQDKFEERLRTDRQKWQLTGVTAALGLVASIVMFFLNGGPT